MTKVRIEYGDYWYRLFIDGKFVDNGHTVEVGRLLERLGIECEELYGDFEGDGGRNDVFITEEDDE